MLSSVNDKNGTITYTYDLISGLKSVTTYDGSTIEYNYDNASHLTAIKTPFGTTKYEYDLNGNLIKKIESGQTTTYTYYAQNRLIRVTVQSGHQVNVEECRYDYAGNRIAKIGELGTFSWHCE